MRNEKALLLKRIRVTPAEDTLFGSQFRGQDGERARNVVCSSGSVDSGWASTA